MFDILYSHTLKSLTLAHLQALDTLDEYNVLRPNSQFPIPKEYFTKILTDLISAGILHNGSLSSALAPCVTDVTRRSFPLGHPTVLEVNHKHAYDGPSYGSLTDFGKLFLERYKKESENE